MIKLLLLTFSLNAFASGSLILEPSYDPERDSTHLTFGLGVYEKLIDGIVYNSWSGFGDSYDIGSNYHSWYVSKHQIDLQPSHNFTFSPGVKFNYLDDEKTGYKKRFFAEVYAKLSVKIW